MILMQSIYYKFIYLMIVGAKYMLNIYINLEKYKIKNVDQTIVKRFGTVRSADLNGLVRSGNFSDRNFLFCLILVSDQTKLDRVHA